MVSVVFHIYLRVGACHYLLNATNSGNIKFYDAMFLVWVGHVMVKTRYT